MLKYKNGTIRGRLADGTPNPVDIHVGKRLREARIMRGLSQDRLANEMGVTFQQVQKYEKGLNRIGASRLWDLAQVLGLPVSFFYDRMNESIQAKSPRNITELREENPADELIMPGDLELVRYFHQIRTPDVARHVLELVRAVALSEAEMRDSLVCSESDDENEKLAPPKKK